MATNVPRSTLWRMADTLMAGRLQERLTELRGEGRSYDEISRVLYAEGHVNISGRTVRDWCVQLADDADDGDPEPGDLATGDPAPRANGDTEPETKAS